MITVPRGNYIKFIRILMFLFAMGCADVQKDWEKASTEAKASPDINSQIAAYQNFLTRHPKGPLAKKAHITLEELFFKKTNYDTALSNTYMKIEGYLNYIKQFPEGQYADKAKFILRELYFKYAIERNTIKAYEEFLKYYPEGMLAEEARSRLNKTIRIEVKESYHCSTREIERLYREEKVSRYERRLYSLFDESIEDLMRYAGFIPAKMGDSQAHFSLSVTARGETVGKTYSAFSGTGSIFVYTGASLGGTIVLEIPRKGKYMNKFQGNLEPPPWIGVSVQKRVDSTEAYDSAYEDPSEALRQAFKIGKFQTYLAVTFGKAFGSKLLIETLERMNSYSHLGEVKIEDLPAGMPMPAPAPQRQALSPVIEAVKEALRIINEKR